MKTWIALFRGINVGGNNILPMADLKRDLESLGLESVRTYIQSGNVAFDSSLKSGKSIGKKISDRIENVHGFRPNVVILSRAELEAAISDNPFPDAISEPKTLSFFFLQSPPTDADTSALEAAKSSTESYSITDRVFYLHAPDGFGRSKLAKNAEKYLGVAATARNYRTVGKLAEIVSSS